MWKLPIDAIFLNMNTRVYICESRKAKNYKLQDF